MISFDGIKDSLTHLAAPPLFYAELHREVSRFARNGQSFSLIRLLLLPNQPEGITLNEEPESKYEVVVLDFAEILSRASRAEDLLARMGEREFIVLVHGRENVAAMLVDRVMNRWQARCPESLNNQGLTLPTLQSAHITAQPNESALEVLNRLDRKVLVTAKL
ncbi:MAG TPA: diguanylate cyclase [Candidatus Nanopelagicaceae bacterium]|nr:diguanylate cyclase [Candidatus Nanopelagicaceae bacterium]